MPSQAIKDKGKVFRDPVHRLIRIEQADQFILDLINTPEFQRLRRVRQLGVSSLTYHGAEHSRFVHSLGVFNFAQRIIAALKRRYGPEHPVSKHLDEHSRVAKAAALLHDIGHGPFSHMIERAASSSFRHEAMTSRLITASTGISRILAGHGISPKDVADVIEGTFPYPLIIDIVSSQLDADRMDYLLRDSLMTGVEYGVYDAEWLLNAMCVGRDPGASETGGSEGMRSENAWRLCLDRERGLYAAEQLILARHHMMLQVYMHRVTRGYEVMLLNVFQSAASLARNNALPAGTPLSVVEYFSKGIEMAPEHWLRFDETAMGAALQAWSGCSGSSDVGWISRMSRAFLDRERVFLDFAVGRLGTRGSMELERGLAEAGLQECVDWGLDNGKHLPYKGVYYKAATDNVEEASTLSILLSDGNPEHNGRAIENESSILKRLDNDPLSLEKLYLDREKISEARGILTKLKIPLGVS